MTAGNNGTLTSAPLSKDPDAWSTSTKRNSTLTDLLYCKDMPRDRNLIDKNGMLFPYLLFISL
jgi:hypothetical protein